MLVASAHLRLELITKCTGSRAGVSLAVAWEARISLELLAGCTPVNPHLSLCFLSLQWRRMAPTSPGASGASVPRVPGLRAEVWDRHRSIDAWPSLEAFAKDTMSVPGLGAGRTCTNKHYGLRSN